jgi:hypothetical protein
MNTGMPLVHQARRTLRNRAEGNPFATDSYIAILLVEMAAAYANASPRVAQLLHVEMDALGDLIV